MIKNLITFAISALMITSLFSQTIYPKKIVLGRDTVIAIQQEQIKACNFLFVDRDRLSDIKDSLYKQIVTRDTLIESLNELNKIKTLEFQAQEEYVYHQDTTIIYTKNKLLNSGIYAEKQKRYKLISYGFSVVILTLLIILK